MSFIIKVLPSAVVAIIVAGGAVAQTVPPVAAAAQSIRQENCVLTMINSCTAGGRCTPSDNLKGEKLPVKITIDLEAGIVAGVDPNGWIEASRIASLARTPSQIILQGIDNAVAWQVLIYQKDNVMSFETATGDTANVGFGTCTAVKPQ